MEHAEKLNNFALIRKERKMLQEDVASALGVDRSSVAKWETGKAVPRATMLIKLADLFHCTVDELLRND